MTRREMSPTTAQATRLSTTPRISSGNITNYIFFAGQRLARNIPQPSPNPPDIKYYITDHLHSTAVFADKNGTVLDDNDFYPWGGVVPGVGTTTSNNHYKFTGKERDTESQLDYFGARYYANITGRFMSPDWAAKPTSVPYAEFGDPQSLNLYSYVRNSPIVRVDADGHGLNDLSNIGFGGTQVDIVFDTCKIWTCALAGESSGQSKQGCPVAGHCEITQSQSMTKLTHSEDGNTLTITTDQTTSWVVRDDNGQMVASGRIENNITVTIPSVGEPSATTTYSAAAMKRTPSGDFTGDPQHSHAPVTASIDMKSAYVQIGSTLAGSPGDASFRGYQTLKNAVTDHSFNLLRDAIRYVHNEVELVRRRQEAEHWIHVAESLVHFL